MSDAKGGLCLVVDDDERFRADLKLLDVRGGENELAHSKRLAPYANRAMQEFAKAAGGPTLYPSSSSALSRCLMHWSKQNGWYVFSVLRGAKFDYATDVNPEYDWPEWHERTSHAAPDVTFTHEREGFVAVADRSGGVIIDVWDGDIFDHSRVALNRYEAEQLADFLKHWIRSQRNSVQRSFCERVGATWRAHPFVAKSLGPVGGLLRD